MPDALALHVRIEFEHRRRRRRRRVPQFDAIAIAIAPKPKLEGRHLAVLEAFALLGSLANTTGNRLRTRPECRRQSAFAGGSRRQDNRSPFAPSQPVKNEFS